MRDASATLQRVLVIGCPGAGKSTLARIIAERLGVEPIHLDTHYWQPGWVRMPQSEWHPLVTSMVQRPTWVMDGNFQSTLPMRLDQADAVVFLDMPRRICLWRICKRLWEHRGGQNRAELAKDCPERWDWAFMRFVWRFPRLKRPGLLALLETYRDGRTIYRLRNTREVLEFVQGLPHLSLIHI